MYQVSCRYSYHRSFGKIHTDEYKKEPIFDTFDEVLKHVQDRLGTKGFLDKANNGDRYSTSCCIDIEGDLHLYNSDIKLYPLYGIQKDIENTFKKLSFFLDHGYNIIFKVFTMLEDSYKGGCGYEVGYEFCFYIRKT